MQGCLIKNYLGFLIPKIWHFVETISLIINLFFLKSDKSPHFLVIECGKHKQTAVKYGGYMTTGVSSLQCQKFKLGLQKLKATTFCGEKCKLEIA